MSLPRSDPDPMTPLWKGLSAFVGIGAGILTWSAVIDPAMRQHDCMVAATHAASPWAFAEGRCTVWWRIPPEQVPPGAYDAFRRANGLGPMP